MTADNIVSDHLIDNPLLHDIELIIINYVHLTPPVTTIVAGHHRVFGVGKRVLVVNVVDHQGSKHPVQFPDTIVPARGCHLFWGETASAKRMNMVITKRSYLDLCDVRVPLGQDEHCSMLDHLKLSTATASHA